MTRALARALQEVLALVVIAVLAGEIIAALGLLR